MKDEEKEVSSQSLRELKKIRSIVIRLGVDPEELEQAIAEAKGGKKLRETYSRYYDSGSNKTIVSKDRLTLSMGDGRYVSIGYTKSPKQRKNRGQYLIHYLNRRGRDSARARGYWGRDEDETPMPQTLWLNSLDGLEERRFVDEDMVGPVQDLVDAFLSR